MCVDLRGAAGLLLAGLLASQHTGHRWSVGLRVNSGSRVQSRPLETQ